MNNALLFQLVSLFDLFLGIAPALLCPPPLPSAGQPHLIEFVFIKRKRNVVDVFLLFSDSLAVGSTIKDRNVCFKSTATQIVNGWRRGGVEREGVGGK